MREAGISFERQVPIPIIYKSKQISEGFRADIFVAREVILEIKSIATLLLSHEAQRLTYLRMSGIRLGLILNINTKRLAEGIRRYAA